MKQLNEEIFNEFEKEYDSDEKNRLIANAISNVGVFDASYNQNVANTHSFIFSNEVKTSEITNQKKTGRCWLFAGLNMLRIKIEKDLNMENFEFSQNYLYFYDNMEQANNFIEKIIETKDKPITDRNVERVFYNFIPEDGGYFEYFKGLIEKYGIVPKSVMSETFSSEASYEMFFETSRLLSKAAMDIRKAKNEEEINKIKKDALSKSYNIFVKCLGKPVKNFDFIYYDKDGKYHEDLNLNPKEFYKKYLGDYLKDKIRVTNDPRNEYNRIYVQEDANHLYEALPFEVLNISMDDMSNLIEKTILDEKSVWFACDVGQFMDRKSGILDIDLYNFDETLVKTENFTKAEMIDSRFSLATHAMNITGFLKKNDKIEKWKVENSWGDENGKNGYFSMTDDWFRKFTYEAIIDKEYLSEENLKAYKKEKIKYNIFDPLYLSMLKTK
ncbi:MAG: C1 family peptidase [Peptoniphilaceae bacterium]|nr:aminopeptidase [Peptoniphilaceae bacterium]MDD7383109.1 C1 family peptidase [Peptoniphilaceae bacterium]MDY3737544.1 C1 family peptidase [Peptoniphilaceae bacterium]